MFEKTRRALPGRLAWLLILGANLVLGTVRPARAADAENGAKVFNSQCAECHTTKVGENPTGPSLFGVVGRDGGSVPGYRYSEAMTNSGLAWTDDKLDLYLAAPRELVPGGMMRYKGRADSDARADLTTFLSKTR